MPLRRELVLVCLLLSSAAATAAAQDQRIVVDQPLQACTAVAPLTESSAPSLIDAAIGSHHARPYYIIHDTTFADAPFSGRMVVAAEQWRVFHGDWTTASVFADSRRRKHFDETRIFGSSDVGLVYRYANVPVADVPDLDGLMQAWREVQARSSASGTETLTARQMFARDLIERMRVARANADAPAKGEAADTRLLSYLPPGDVTRIQKFLKDAPLVPGTDAETTRLIWLEAARYLRGFQRGDKSVIDEMPLVALDTNQPLVWIAPGLATTSGFQSLRTLHYQIDVTRKSPAPVENLKGALAIVAQAAAGTVVRLPMKTATLCAGRMTPVQALPSDMLVRALHMSADGKEEVERSKQLFDNEAMSWWDVSFLLPADFRRDVTIDADAGQLAGKSVEKTDLYAAFNIGWPRDTKKAQWLAPSFVYGVSITGKPLHHQIFGLSLGLNYAQLFVGYRLDRTQTIARSSVDGIPVAVEQPERGHTWSDIRWSHPIVGLNLPVSTIAKLFKKDDKGKK